MSRVEKKSCRRIRCDLSLSLYIFSYSSVSVSLSLSLVVLFFFITTSCCCCSWSERQILELNLLFFFLSFFFPRFGPVLPLSLSYLYLILLRSDNRLRLALPRRMGPYGNRIPYFLSPKKHTIGPSGKIGVGFDFYTGE